MKGLKGRLKEKIALLRLRQGDTEAFGFIYESYVDRIYRYISFKISDRGTAYDITQDVFLKTWEYIRLKRPVDNVQSFLFKLAYRKVVDYFRVKERQAHLIDSTNEEEASSAAVEKSSELEMHFLIQNVRHLRAEYQDVIILKHIEGLSTAEIAAVLGKDTGGVRVLLHRAINSLRKRLGSRASSHPTSNNQ